MLMIKDILFKSILIPIFFFTSFIGLKSVSASDNSLHQKYQQIYKLKKNAQPGDWFQGAHIKKVFIQTAQKKNLYTFLNINDKIKDTVKEGSSDLSKEIDKKTPKNFKEPGFVFGTMQTYTLIYMLALIHIVVEDNELSNIDPNLLGQPQTTEKLLTTAYELGVSGEMISSLLMAGATHKVFHLPLNKLNQIVMNKSLVPLFKNLIISFSNSLVSFTGWEFGTQLWKESINMLEFQLTGEVEKKYLEDKNRLLVNAFKVISHGKGRADTKEVVAARKILNQTFQNMLYMLTLGSDGQIQWLYNTLRHRLLSGHFVSLILSMGSASAIGSTYLPLLSPLLSTFGIGLAGGLASIYLIPEEQKHQVTTLLKEKIHLGVLNVWDKRSTTTSLSSGFDERSTDQQNKFEYVSKVDKDKTFKDVMNDRISYRQKVIDTNIDQVHYYYNRLIYDNDLLTRLYEFIPHAQGEQSDKAEKKIDELIKANITNKASLFQYLEKMISFYIEEAQNFDHFGGIDSNRSVAGYLDLEKISAESLASHFCSIALSFLQIDFIKSKDELSTNKDKAIENIANMCAIEVPAPKFSYSDLSSFRKKMFDSAVYFMEQSVNGRFNETELVFERTKALHQSFGL